MTDVSFIVFILVPGYMTLWPGLQGLIAWGIALILWTWSYALRRRRSVHNSEPQNIRANPDLRAGAASSGAQGA
jgi:hypothetical protein